MSSDESEANPQRRKRKIRRLSDDSQTSTSSLSPIVGGPSNRRRRKVANIREESPDSESSGASGVLFKRKKVGRVQSNSESSSSDDDSSPVIANRKWKKQILVSESESSESSGSDIVPRRTRSAAPLSMTDSESSDSQWESDFSDSDNEASNKPKATCSSVPEEKAIDSDSSDGQSEKCPICLLSFRLQEVGIPENCEHTFCLECIQEWSKNMNTCPVDRKEYNSITVKKCINGRFLRKVQIERPEVQEDGVDIVEDPTYCEICGSNDHEDRLLLCDGCDLGFHLYCLTPPLDEVPEGTWYCNDCYPGVNQEIDYEEVARLYDDLEENFGGPLVTRRSTTRRQSTRLVPRTRQTERVRRRIETNRNQRQQQNFELDDDEPTSSRRVNSSRISSSTRKHKKKSNKKSKSKKTKSAQYRTVYVIDKVTGEAVPVKRKIKSRRRKKKRNFRRYQTERVVQKTVKKRLAAQLGMCTSNSVPQALPDIRLSSSNSNSIGQRRFQAGIPSLDIVGSRLQLEYFSQSEDEGISNDREVGGVHTLLARRASNPLDVLSLRRVARRKAALVNVPTVSSSTDILGNIMDSQEKFLSKNSIISVVDSSGKLQIENKKSEPILNNNSPSKPDFNSYSVKQKPWYGGGRHNSGYRYQNRNWSNNRNWQNNYRGNQGGYYSGPSNTYDAAGSGSGNNYMQGGDQNNDIPQDYTQRTLCEAELLQDTEDKDKRTPGSNTPVSDTEVDIYGDIENVPVSTSTGQEELRPPSPPMMQQQSNTPNTNTDEDNDSESGMVIDTERYQDEPVTSTVGIVPGQAYTPEEPTYSPGHPTYSPDQPTYSPEPPTYNPDQPPPYNADHLPPFNPDQPPPFKPDQLPPFNPDQPPPFNPDQPPPFNPNRPPPYNPSRPPPYTPDKPPPYNPDRPTYSPEHPTYSPEKPTYSPGEPTYSPGEPTPYDPPESEPENTSSYGQADSEVSGYEQLQEIASGYDELQREIASGYDQLQREFASSFNQSQSDPNPFQEKPDLDSSRSEPDIVPDRNQFEPENNLSYNAPSSENNLDHNHEVKNSESDQTQPQADLDYAPPEIKTTVDVGVTDKNSAVITPTETENNKEDDNGHQKFDDEEYSNDGCPNFSIYSRESKTVALTTDISLPPSARDQPEQPIVEASNENSTNIEAEPERLINESIDQITDESESLPAVPQKETTAMTVEKTFGPGSDPRLKKQSSGGFWNLGGLYSDSEDESVVKKSNTFGISDIKDMTEDIVSEEERSYTPVLDENARKSKEGLEGLDTEMISDEDRNDFDESHELKTVSDGDALEINAKESELEFTRPEEFEEGEIVDKNKDNTVNEEIGGTPEKPRSPDKNKEKDKDKSNKKTDKENKKKKKEKGKNIDRSKSADGGANKENENRESFKKLTRSNKDRNYRDKDKGDKDKETSKQNRERSRSKTPVKSNDRERETKRKREKRKDLERYNVRAIIAEKPRPPPKDQFGRDLPSRSRSRSYTPPLVPMSPIARRSPSPIRAPRSLSRRKSRSASRGKTPPRGHRSLSRRRSGSRMRDKNRKRRSRSRHRTHSRSRSRGRKRDRSKNKKRKRSRSKSNKRKKSKERDRAKARKRSRKSGSRTRRRSSRSLSGSPRQIRRDWTPSFSRSPTPPPMSPSWTPPRTDNSQALRNQNLTVILNNNAAKKKRDKRNRERRRKDDPSSKRRRRERERTPPPSKEVFASGDNILVSVSFNNENETRDVSTRDNRKRKEAAAAEQQKKNKERRNRNKKDLSGVKPVAIIDLERSPFQEITASPKDVIVLSDSDNNENENGNIHTDICDSSQQVASPERTPNYTTGPKTPPEPSIKFTLLPKPQQLRAINNPLHDPLETIEEEMQEELNNSTHKGPNTPPEEPPTSPPSSPDAYDPFEPTKSRSPTPEPIQVEGDVGNEQNLQEPLENRSSIDLLEKSGQTPDVIKSLTPPIAEIQPADSQSSIHENSEPKSPEQRIGVVINQIIQPANGKPVAQTTPFSSVPTSMITSTSVPSSMANSRINIINSSIITSVSSIPQRIVLPNQVKSSPVKISPTKAAVKSTPIKPMQSKNNKKGARPQNGNSLDDITLDFDSPYSPGSSDYEDLFEPPADLPTATVKPKSHSKSKITANTQKHQSTFDNLFGSPSYNKKSKRSSKKTGGSNKTKHVGVKIDEDSLKILEELPNSAVEMQFLKKLNRQERVVEEVKLVLKPYYNKKKITKNEYKDIMRRAVPKICHNKTGEINPIKIRQLIEAYVKKVKHSKKVTSSSSLPQKVV